MGLVTAALSIVKLVNDKESKTTDYRQDWCNSVRKSVAELISNINATASLIVNHGRDGENLEALLKANHSTAGAWSEKDAAIRDHLTSRIAESIGQIRTLRRELFQAYAFTRLHFKPEDPSFLPIEGFVAQII